MKYLRLLALLALLLPAAGSALPMRSGKSADGIHWAGDLATGMALSAREGLPLITYFTFDT